MEEVDAAADISNDKDVCAVIAADASVCCPRPRSQWGVVLIKVLRIYTPPPVLHLLKHSLNKVAEQEEVR